MAPHVSCQTLPGDTERIRAHSFTRWMSRDLLQAATDFCMNIGLVPIYAEHAPDHSGRYLFWRPPQDARFEVRSGRTEEQFRQYDEANIKKGWPLLSLHISDNGIHSAVWISPEHYDAALAMLGFYGITAAQRTSGG